MNLGNSAGWLANLKSGFLKAGLLNCWGAPGGNSGVQPGGTNRRLLFFELFVALSLCVTYYFLVEYFAVGSPNNYTNGWVFTSCSIPGFHLDKIGDVWKGRLSGLLLSGWLFDFVVKDNRFGVGQYENLFGLYQCVWLFLLFLAVIFALRHSLFINFGIFAGLMYGFTPASGLYFYPWDLPGTLFFTLAILFFARRQMFLMAVATCAGCFFKETVLVCALLALFAGHWKWWKRILTFVAIVAVYVLGKKFLLSQLHLHVAAFSMNNATSLMDLFKRMLLIGNVETLLSPTLNHVIFVNAGTLLAVLALGWQRRFLPYMVVIVIYLGGQFIYGGINEFRIFMQILPLSLMLMSERWQESGGSGPAAEPSARPAPAWALRETFPVLIPLTIVLIGLSTGIAAGRYYRICENLRSNGGAPSELGKRNIELKGHVSNLIVEYQALRNEYVKDELELAKVSIEDQRPLDAISHYERALEQDTNSVVALSSLAWMRATAADPQLRKSDEAVRLAERACQLTQNQDAALVGILAAACAEAGRFSDAVVLAEKAHAQAVAQGQKDVAERTEQLLKLYKSGQPYHQEARPAP